MSPTKDLELSIVVVGDSRCGKTQLINKFQNFNFCKVYNPTGFNKIEEVVKYNQTDLKLTVWDTSGLPSYTTLRPLVYSECSAVLLCYTGDGLTSLDAWVREVRRSTGAPIVLAHTRSDEAGRLDMRRTCRVCERLGAAGWETTSASSGQNVNTVFDLCVAAAMDSNVRSDNKKDRLVRPNTLQLSSMVSNLESHKNNKTWADNTGILSPTGSTVSSLLSIPVFPSYRSQQSDTSSVSAMTSASVSLYSDQDSVTSLHTPAPLHTRYRVYSRSDSREKKKELCSVM